jgi:hypothetical protein
MPGAITELAVTQEDGGSLDMAAGAQRTCTSPSRHDPDPNSPIACAACQNETIPSWGTRNRFLQHHPGVNKVDAFTGAADNVFNRLLLVYKPQQMPLKLS